MFVLDGAGALKTKRQRMKRSVCDKMQYVMRTWRPRKGCLPQSLRDIT